MSLLDCVINWTAPASLKHIGEPIQGFTRVGDRVYDGTLAGAIRKFATLKPDEQRRIELVTEPGVIEGVSATVISYENLKTIAARPDVPVE